MKLVPGQKAVAAFANILVTTICLAVFLDNPGGEKSFICLCLSVFITDAACFGHLFLSIYTGVRAGNQQPFTFVNLWNFMFPFNNVYTGQFVCLTCKVVFEVLIAVRLTFSVSIPYIAFFIPFWIFCGIIFIDLSLRLYSIQNKASNN